MVVVGNTLQMPMDSLTASLPEDVSVLLDRQFNRIQQLPAVNHCDRMVLRMCCESGYNEKSFALFENFLTRVKTKYPRLKIFLICNSWFRKFLSQGIKNLDGIFYIDFFLFRVYHRLMIEHRSPVTTSWDPQNTSVLFLTAKCYRIHRVRLLYKLLHSPLAPRLDWSFWVQDQEEQELCRQYLADISDTEYQEFLKYQRKADEYFSPKGIPYSSSLYKTSIFQIVSETFFDRPFQHPWITEKTWLAMINKKPFIMAGEFDTLAHLRSMGFHTFERFLSVPNYDSPDSSGFLVQAKDSKMITTEHQHRDWCDFYSSIRDPSWPQNVSLGDVDFLPAAIKQELLENYKPLIEDVSDLRLAAIVKNAVDWTSAILQQQTEISHQVTENYQRLVQLAELNHRAFLEFTGNNNINYSVDSLLDG